MSLSDILAQTELRVIVDGKIGLRSESDRSQIAVKFVKADDASDLLTRSLALDETPIAAIPDSGAVYILSPGTHGLICLQGTTANKAQKATMEKLAKAYSDATGLMLPDWYVPKLDTKKVVKEFVPSDESDGEAPVAVETPSEESIPEE